MRGMCLVLKLWSFEADIVLAFVAYKLPEQCLY